MANGGLTEHAPSTVFKCAYACVPYKWDHWIRVVQVQWRTAEIPERPDVYGVVNGFL